MLAGPARSGEVPDPRVRGAFLACESHPDVEQDPESPSGARRRGREDEGDEAPPPLAETCPEVHAIVSSAPFAQFLPDDWGQHPSRGRIAQLRSLLESPPPAAAGPRPDPVGVTPILEQIRGSQVQLKKSLWQRFKDWLAAILERRSGGEDSGWLLEWLREHAPSARTMEFVAYGVMVLLIGGAIWIVAAELRASGVLRRAARAREQAAAGTAPPQARAISLADASDQELPALLIALLLDRLRALGLVQDRLSMTHRELASAARLQSADDRAAFATLVATAERLRYAAIAPAGAQLRAAIEAARALLARLMHPPRSPA